MSNQYVTIKEAAELLGFSTLTLRNWDKKGKLKAFRHPMNNYRVYKIEDIQGVLGEIKVGEKPSEKPKREFKKVLVRHIPYSQ